MGFKIAMGAFDKTRPPVSKMLNFCLAEYIYIICSMYGICSKILNKSPRQTTKTQIRLFLKK